MARINKERERKLIEAAERALSEAGFRATKVKFKHYAVDRNGRRQKIIVRTSADRWLGFNYSGDHWVTLGDSDIEGVVVATFDDKDNPTKMIVYSPIPRAELQQRFDEVRATWAAGGMNMNDPRVWICLDRRDTGKVWDAGSGIVEDFSLTPIGQFSLRNESERTDQAMTEAEMQSDAEEPFERAARGSISMIVDMDDNERRMWTEYYGRKLEVDPRRLAVEVRLTFLT